MQLFSNGTIPIEAGDQFRAGVKIESLEERSLFSAGFEGGIVFESQYHPAAVYVAPLQVAAAQPAVAGEATKVIARPQVKLFASDESDLVLGVYSNAPVFGTPVREVHAGISARGTAALTRVELQSFAGRPPEARPAGLPPAKGRNVLLIEDDRTSRMALMAVLKRRGWNVTLAATLKEGLGKLQQKPDEVIVDLMLPDGDGEKVVEQIRDSHMGSKVIVMTGVSDPERLAKLDHLHPSSILNKPIDLAALLRAM